MSNHFWFEQPSARFAQRFTLLYCRKAEVFLLVMPLILLQNEFFSVFVTLGQPPNAFYENQGSHTVWKVYISSVLYLSY